MNKSTIITPDFIVIGAMKSATSTLYEQLVQQPGIKMCSPKEPNFFSDDDEYNKGIEWYLDLFSEFTDDCITGEASTHYTKLPTYPETVKRLKKHLPETRFIYVMRHPVDRLVSHYIHEWSMGNISCDINDAIAKYPELTNYGCYAMQLDPYLSEYGKDNILPVFFDRLINHPQKELERICAFIGYKKKPLWRSDLNADNVSSKRIRRFPFYNILIDSGIATFLRRTLVPKVIRKKFKQKLRMSERPVINDDIISELEKQFDNDLRTLSDWLGADINCSNFKAISASQSLNWRDNI